MCTYADINPQTQSTGGTVAKHCHGIHQCIHTGRYIGTAGWTGTGVQWVLGKRWTVGGNSTGGVEKLRNEVGTHEWRSQKNKHYVTVTEKSKFSCRSLAQYVLHSWRQGKCVMITKMHVLKDQTCNVLIGNMTCEVSLLSLPITDHAEHDSCTTSGDPYQLCISGIFQYIIQNKSIKQEIATIQQLVNNSQSHCTCHCNDCMLSLSFILKGQVFETLLPLYL